MKYIPIIQTALKESDKQNTDDSPIKIEPFKSEKNYLNYNHVLTLNIAETEGLRNSYIIPTEDDYKNGYYIRYFLKKRNEMLIQEVDNTIYNADGVKFDNTLYEKFELIWKLNGPLHDKLKNNSIIEYGIIDTNKRTVNAINKKYNISLDKIIRNYSEFAI